MRAQPGNRQITGIALLLFFAVLLGVGIHHLVATGTCSSTGYSGNFGPVPTCPSGTGWWFAFVFGGIIGSLTGALMAGSMGLVFAGIFGAIGFGALSIVLDAHAQSGEKVFAAIFGGCFALVGVAAGAGVIASAIGSVRNPAVKSKRAPAPEPVVSSAFGTPRADSAFGTPTSEPADPIFSAYTASQTASASHAGASAPAPASTPGPSPLSLVSGLRAARRAASSDVADELAKLADLHQRGALTDAEFASAKAKLLGRL